MQGKKSENNAIYQHLTENVFSQISVLSEKLTNLAPSYCGLVLYNAMGFQLTKKCYFGIAFPLSDESHINELKDLSNGYLEFKNGTVTMGVTELENLQAILSALSKTR